MLRKIFTLGMPLLVVGAILVVILNLPGGTGRMVSATPRFLILNLYYNYTAPSLDVMRNAYQEASRLLFNSTNGQLHIGTVRVSDNSAFQNKADAWVNSGAAGAYSSVGGLGTPGMHSTFFENRHKWTNQDGPGNNEIGQFGIIHEMGHYVFNLGDEYYGPSGSAYCVSTTDSVSCIMDGGTTVDPNHHRTEWCTPHGGGLSTAHVTSPVTDQESAHACSCWDTIVSYCSSQFGIALTAPTSVQTTDPAGLPALNWVRLGDKLRMVIDLDRSYSMSVSNKLTLAKQAAVLFVDLCQNDADEYLGAVSFSNSATTDFPIENVTAAGNTKSNATAAINALVVENMTALGDGLRRSLNEITGGGTVASSDAAVEAIVLLSDGVHNYGTESPAAVLPDLRDRGVLVYSIGLGNATDPVYPLDESTLLDISDQTGGSYRHATSATDLASIYVDFAADIRGQDTYPEASGELNREGRREHSVQVDKFTKEQTFILHWPYGEHAFLLEMRRPDGTVVTPATAGVKPSVKGYHVYYRIPNPMPGTWTMIVKGNPKAKWTANSLRYTVQAIAKSPGLHFQVAPRQKRTDIGRPVILRAAVYAKGVPVANAEVTGIVALPNAERMRVALRDDGMRKTSGDDVAGDGIYSVRFSNTSLPGTYRISAVVRNLKGVSARPDERDAKWKPFPIEPFTRMSTSTFQVGKVKVRPPKTEKM